MGKPHIHAELIKAWADGAEIEYLNTTDDKWEPIFKGWSWDTTFHIDMRIKPQPKPDFIYFGQLDEPARGGLTLGSCFTRHKADRDQLKLTFDGETGKLKSAEIL